MRWPCAPGAPCRTRRGLAGRRAALLRLGLGLLGAALPACSPSSAQDPDGGGALWCTADEQCGAGSICGIGRCKTGCRNREGCAPGLDCIGQQCVPRQDAGPSAGQDAGPAAGQDAGPAARQDAGPDADVSPCSAAERLTLCPDGDGDGHGDPARSGRVCPPVPSGWSLLCDDCDDARPLAFPGAREQCNGADDSCDGATDEGLGVGDVCAVSQGSCRREGRRGCTPEGLVTCDALPGAPRPELCNELDDDCNGVVDDPIGGCECQEGQRRSCGSDVGSCKLGEQRCLTGSWGACAGGVGPGAETCNGLDDDCDGTLDDVAGGCECRDGEQRGCGTDEGECRTGSQRCAAGRWGGCLDGVGPAEEVCNGLDDDCDGQPDDGVCGGCPEEMAKLGGRFCIDRWEASRPDATADSPGQDGSRATSRPGVLPWYVNPMSLAALTTFEQACQATGKRLCTPDEWFEACTGPDQTRYFFGDVWDREACNCVDSFCDDHCTAQGIEPCDTGDGCGYRYDCYRVQPTGAFPRCTNADGVFDVNGNVWEVVPDGSARGYQVRGGAFNCASPAVRLQCTFDAGWEALYAGFRCCRTLGGPLTVLP